ncbi:tannase and feruloyl esterase [Mycena pura]|uniref:Carboxylic ester hydrolase n=1 Tax=Mycena pura TaxID=153505 RepID=A0AAD6VE66_9AGAR|nr:tannase and feruloyl esterase [Mycena pura]
MDLSGFNLNYLSNLVTSSIPLLASWTHGEQYTKCLALKSSLTLENTTILDVSYVAAGSTVKLHGQCVPKAHVAAPLCRVQFSTQTSSTSAIRAEAWLPDEWYGRFLAVGNGGLGGCISYRDLTYGSALHFATVGSNNGHDGDTGTPFLGNPEVLYDFAFRSIHVEAVIGKQISESYYGRRHDKSYYLGCSTGGRQGTQTAYQYPEDFDGIMAGAPANDMNHLMHWTGMLARHIGAPDSNSPAFIPLALWKVVADEIMRQCDALDGVVDGIITEPDACAFRPEALLCHNGDSKKCLTSPQVEALRRIYAPLYGDGDLIYPRFDPGAESLGVRAFSGQFPQYPADWLKYTVLNVTDFDFSDYGPEQGRLVDKVNPGGIAAFVGDLSPFRDRGGKFITYHGRMDPLIASGNSKRMYDLIARALGAPRLDDFYRLFLVPGMGHCAGGSAASAPNFGQNWDARAANASSHNLLLALVDWVEGGVPPDTITGTTEDGRATRVHCRYPLRSVWNGSEFGCEE